MGEFQSLLLVLAAIYLAECFVWIRRGALAFGRWWRADFGLCQSGVLWANQRGGLTLANPLPPLGTVFLSAPFPLSLAPDAAYAHSATSLSIGGRPIQTGQHLCFDDFKSIEADGRRVLVNDKLFLLALSPFEARRLAQSLRRLKQLPAKERAAAIREQISESLDQDKISARLEQLKMRARTIRLLSNGLFLYLFVLAPAGVWRLGLAQIVWFLLGGMLAQTISIAILFQRAHRSLYPDGREERFTPFLTMLLAPPTAIRAGDILSCHLLEHFHPLAVARVLCAPDQFKDFARQILLDLRFPMLPVCPTIEPGPVETERWFRAFHQEAVEKFATRSGLKLDELLKPPEPSEPSNLSYCPRCHAQFVTREGTCADCGGRALVPFTA
ncbi:MAG TPA: hypothetical protein VGK40_04475 [Verrucomicrobiae bacterium]